MDTALQNQTVLDLVKKTCALAAAPLAHAAETGAEAMHTFVFSLDSLQDFSSVDIRTDAEHRAVFERLAAIERPVVYVFEIISATSPSAVLAAARAYTGPRAVPARRSNIDETSLVLYVGKVKKALWGRVIQHLGFSRTAATQGLQLYHWTQGMALELQLTVFEFRDDMADLLPLLEKAIANELKPLLGKHQ